MASNSLRISSSAREAVSAGGAKKEAREIARGLVGANPSLENRLFLANVQRETGAAHEAAVLYELILDEQPDQILALANLSLIRAEQGRWDDAQMLARRAMDLSPPESQLRRRLEPILKHESQ